MDFFFWFFLFVFSAPGRFANAPGSTLCLPIRVGYYASNIASTTEYGDGPCPFNTFCAGGNIQPTPCPSGSGSGPHAERCTCL